MTQTDEWLSICDAIDDGEHDDGLDQMARAIKSRLDVVIRRNARRLIRELKPKDRVMVTNNPTPRFLDGMVGTVRELREGAALVILDEVPSGRGRPPSEGRNNRLLVPFENLIKLDPDDARAQKDTRPPKDEVGDDEEYEELDDDEEDEDDDD